ncbi:MAG: DUF983 domain-containing protein [Pseudomonadota bacterium]|nr:DUF983 domain-containing protein [Pseudomonadota bacterium]
MSDIYVSPFRAGLACRCPRCGEGKLYAGFLEVGKGCDSCGLDYARVDSGDGPAVFVILILGAIIVGLALVLEVNAEPPLWVHAVLWGPLTIIGAMVLLRPFKALLIALQFRNRATQDIDLES